MLIKKIIKVENVGCFAKLSPSGNVEFRRLTLVYADNGHGKSTLAGILRSLRNGDGEHVMERARLGSLSQPFVELLSPEGKLSFRDGAWSATCADIEIFDTTFVAQNVYAGDQVDIEHRKNLYDVVVGEEAVTLARDVDQFDADGRAAAIEARKYESEIQNYIQGPFEVQDFIELEAEADVEEKISELTTRLGSVHKSKEVVARPSLNQIEIPTPPKQVFAALAVGVEKLSDEVEARCVARIAIDSPVN